MANEQVPPEDVERFRIVHFPEIVRILRAVMQRRALVTAYGSSDRDFIVTRIVGLAPDERSFYIGGGVDARQDDALLRSPVVAFNTAHDQVRVLFRTPGVELAVLDGERVLRAAVPNELLRFQRREFFRMTTPLANPVRCRIPGESGVVEGTVVDISIGGLGMLSPPDEAPLREGETYSGCWLALPDAGNLLVSLQICTLYRVTLRNGVVSRRAGCKFVSLAPSLETEIQRYIIRLERERRAHSL